MNVYSAEINDGIGDLIKANTTIAYTSPLIKLDQELEVSDKLIKAFADNNPSLNFDKRDLYPLCSILVSVGINKNDDVFVGEEVWAARNSPEDKPLNILHNQLNIIGHITSNHPVDTDFKLIANDTPVDQLPAKFHILTSSVLYKYWEDRARQAQVAQILDEIENRKPSKWAVSMECYFAGFDFSVMDHTGNARIIQRTEQTAGLTKHLRAYGGGGTFENYKVGRVLRRITFGGVGLVDNPANPESIIFDQVKTFASLGYIELSQLNNNKESEMADYKDVEKLVADVKAEITGLKPFSDRITALETQVTEKTKAVETAEKKVEELEKEKAVLKAAKEEDDKKIKKMEDDCKAAQAENEAYKKTMEEYKKASRQNAIKAHLGPDVNAEILANGWASLDDENFTAVLGAMPPWLKDKKGGKDDGDADDKKDKGKADFGAHPVDGEKVTDDSTKTENVDQFGKTKPKNAMGNPQHPVSAETVIASAETVDNANLGVSFDNNADFSKTVADVQKFLTKNRKKKGE